MSKIETFCRVKPKSRQLSNPFHIASASIDGYNFNRLFDDKSSQREVYLSTTFPLLDPFFSGINCSVLCYGQTGTGKTYTLTGLIQSLSIDIFDHRTDGELSLSAAELHLESFSDLLSSKKDLKLRQRNEEVYVENLSSHVVKTADELQTLFSAALERRTTSSTLKNDASSRSHCLLTISLKTASRNSKFVLVDLAGSESTKYASLQNHGSLQEGRMINKSLTTLGTVVSCIVKNGYVPYRDSKLTRVLQDVIGGSCRTRFILTVDVTEEQETRSTLRFGDTVRQVKNEAKVNYVKTENDYKEENRRLRRELEVLRSKGRNYKLSSRRSESEIYMPQTDTTSSNMGSKSKSQKSTQSLSNSLSRVGSFSKSRMYGMKKMVLHKLEKSPDGSFDTMMLDMTNKLIDVKMELNRKQAELKKRSRVNVSEFMEVIKRKDKDIVQLKKQLKQLQSTVEKKDQQLTYLQDELSASSH